MGFVVEKGFGDAFSKDLTVSSQYPAVKRIQQVMASASSRSPRQGENGRFGVGY